MWVLSTEHRWANVWISWLELLRGSGLTSGQKMNWDSFSSSSFVCTRSGKSENQDCMSIVNFWQLLLIVLFLFAEGGVSHKLPKNSVGHNFIQSSKSGKVRHSDPNRSSPGLCSQFRSLLWRTTRELEWQFQWCTSHSSNSTFPFKILHRITLGLFFQTSSE